MSGAAAPLSGRRILVVEDEYFIADEIARFLRSAGAEVVGPCPNMSQALRVLEDGEHLLDAALLDVNLAGASSYDLVGALKRRGVPVVLATGYDASSIHERYRGLPLCEKPLNLASVVRALADASG